MLATPDNAAGEPLKLSAPTVPKETIVYAIGDVHGCLDALDALHTKILRDAETSGCTRKIAVYLGDYVDRGPASKQVIDRLIEQPLDGFETIHLMGNHEAMMIDFLADPEIGPGWMFNGGNTTLESYGLSGEFDFETASAETLENLQTAFAEALPDDHQKFLKTLTLCHEIGDYFFVHAGIRPGIPLDNQSDEDMLWIRDDFLDSAADHGKVIVHGHTITWEPQFRGNRIGVDTGAFVSGTLSALILENHEQDILSVGND